MVLRLVAPSHNPLFAYSPPLAPSWKEKRKKKKNVDAVMGILLSYDVANLWFHDVFLPPNSRD